MEGSAEDEHCQLASAVYRGQRLGERRWRSNDGDDRCDDRNRNGCGVQHSSQRRRVQRDLAARVARYICRNHDDKDGLGANKSRYELIDKR